MNKREVMGQIADVGVIPVVRAASAEEALEVVEAIREGGINILEITMTVPGALRVIEELSNRFGHEVLVGAGTVLDAETARACSLAGARFVVSPALNLGTVEMCLRHGVPVFPGALTPTEVITAWQAGADAVKIFPCSAMGGAKYLKALKAPLPEVQLIPTGGVSLETAGELIAAGAFALGVGADLVDTKAISQGKRVKVIKAAESYVAAVREARAQR